MKNLLKKFIRIHFLRDQHDIKDNESLFQNNIIDSFGLLELIAFVEKEFSVSINSASVTADNFDTIDKIIRLIESKK